MDDDYISDAERLAGKMFEQLDDPADEEGIDMIAPSLTLLHAAMNVVLWIIEAAEDDEKENLCAEAQADLNEIVKTILTPDSVFEARKRRALFKIVPPQDKP